MKTKNFIRKISLAFCMLLATHFSWGQCNSIIVFDDDNDDLGYCIGAGGLLEVSWTSGGMGCDAETIEWYEEDGDLIQTTGVGDSYDFTADNSFGIYVEIYDDSTNLIGTSATFQITVNPLPDVIIVSDSMVICAGDLVTFSTEPSNFATYQWSGAAGNSNDPTISDVSMHNDTYNVTVTDNNNCEGTASLQVAVNTPPDIEDLFDVSICLSEGSAQLNACETNGIIETWQWTPNNNLSNSNSCNPIWTPGNANDDQTITLLVTDSNGCTDTDEVEATVEENPMPTLSVSGLECVGEDITITAGNVTSPANFQWNLINGDGDISGSGNPITLEPNSAGEFEIQLIYNNGCEGMASTTFTVNPLPAFDVQNISACEDTQVSLSCGLTNPNDYTITWSPSTGLNDASACDPVYTVGDDDVTFTITATHDVTGCDNSTTLTVSSLEPPVSSINPIDPICTGGVATLAAQPDDSNYSYEWSNGDMTQTISTDPLTSVGSNPFSVTVTDENDCTDTASTIVEVVDQPGIVISTEVGGTIFCTEQDFTLTTNFISGQEGVGPFTYQWSLNGNELSGATNESLTINLTNEGANIVSVSVDDLGIGCLTAEAELEITLIDRPSPMIEGPQEVCINQEALYRIDPIQGSFIDWTILEPQAEIVENFGSFIFVRWTENNNPGMHPVSVSQRIGPEEDDCIGDNEIEVNVLGQTARPTAPILFYEFPGLLISKDSSAGCYQWGFIDTLSGEIGVFQDEIYQAFPVGNLNPDYVYWVRTGDGENCDEACTTISFRMEDGGTFIPVEEKPVFKVYPNPNQGAFNVVTNYLPESEYDLIVSDIWGRVIYQRLIIPNQGAINESILLDRVTNGMYVMTLIGAKGKIARHHKIVVAR